MTSKQLQQYDYRSAFVIRDSKDDRETQLKPSLLTRTVTDRYITRGKKLPSVLDGRKTTVYAYLYQAYQCEVVKITNPFANTVLKPFIVNPFPKVSSHQEVMRQRWASATQCLPLVDKRDIGEEVPLVNGDKLKPMDSRRQHHAEFSQTSYWRHRQQEE